MREIKFRAWLKSENKMVNVKGIFFDEPGLRIEHEYIDDGKNPFDRGYPNTFKKDLELMQFTDIKDKNGKEIYEGDIISGWDVLNKIGRVEFYSGAFRLFEAGLLLTFADNHVNCEVIGNIYENPELII